jgi:hypothetical protein
MGLVAAFSPGFKMYWTRENIAHLQLFHVSAVWDACFKCYLPSGPYAYVAAFALAGVCLCRKMAQCFTSGRQ